MEMTGINNLGIQGITGASGSEHLANRGIFRIRVAGLHHEFIDYTVEQHIVIITLLYKFQEVVAVFRGVTEKAHLYVTLRGLDFYESIGSRGCLHGVVFTIHFF